MGLGINSMLSDYPKMGCGGAQNEELEQQEADQLKQLVKAHQRQCEYYIEKSLMKDVLRQFFSESNYKKQLELEDAIVALRELSLHVTTDEVISLFNLVEQQGKTLLNSDDFLRIYIAKIQGDTFDVENAFLFLSNDIEFKGAISKQQFGKIIKKLGYNGNDIDKMILEQKEEIWYNDFKATMQTFR